jgi:hypothetical protein
MEIKASSFKLRADVPEGRKAISYQPETRQYNGTNRSVDLFDAADKNLGKALGEATVAACVYG